MHPKTHKSKSFSSVHHTYLGNEQDPSSTRGGKELPSISALDSPSVISRIATPKPATAINSDMSRVIDDATSAMHDETTSVLDTTLPLGEFLDEQIARVIQHDVVESDDELETETPETPPRTSLSRNYCASINKNL